MQPESVEVDPETTTETTPDGAPVVPEEETGNDTTFTLEVTPEQAERIAYAFENGSIWLTLVPGDFVEVETTGVTIAQSVRRRSAGRHLWKLIKRFDHVDG